MLQIILKHLYLNHCLSSFSMLNNFQPMLYFYTPLKTSENRRFSEGIEVEHWLKMG